VAKPDDDKSLDDGNQDDKKKVEFSPEQQAKVQELINEAFGKGASKTEKELKKATDAIEALIGKIAKPEEAKPGATKDDKKVDDKKQDDKKDDKGDDKVDGRTQLAKLQASFDELMTNFNGMKTERDTLKGEKEQAVKQTRDHKFVQTFEEVADEFKFFRNQTVRLELADQLRYEEDGSITVLNPKTGQPRLNTEMQPFSLKDLLADYAAKNSHMVKTEVDGGSDSKGNRKVDAPGGRKSIKDMTPDEIKAIEARVAAGERIPVE